MKIGADPEGLFKKRGEAGEGMGRWVAVNYCTCTTGVLHNKAETCSKCRCKI